MGFCGAIELAQLQQCSSGLGSKRPPVKLPISADCLVWQKRNDGLRFSEAELTWTWPREEVAPTQKPLRVIEWSLGMIAAPTVFDRFSAARRGDHRRRKPDKSCYAMERDPRCCDVVIRRWEESTGPRL